MLVYLLGITFSFHEFSKRFPVLLGCAYILSCLQQLRTNNNTYQAFGSTSNCNNDTKIGFRANPTIDVLLIVSENRVGDVPSFLLLRCSFFLSVILRLIAYFKEQFTWIWRKFWVMWETLDDSSNFMGCSHINSHHRNHWKNKCRKASPLLMLQ